MGELDRGEGEARLLVGAKAVRLEDDVLTITVGVAGQERDNAEAVACCEVALGLSNVAATWSLMG